MTLGIDIGTTNVKALVMDLHTGATLAHASAPLTTLNPEPGHAEQEPEAVWKALRGVLAEVMQEAKQADIEVDAVCFSTAMHSLLAVDATGKPITNAILWADNRAEKQADDLRGSLAEQGRAIYQRTGTPIHPMIPLCKLAWFGEHQPRILRRAAKWISLKEYVWHKLTGHYQIDYSIATATGLLDPATKTWYGPALDYAGIRFDQLSELQPTTYCHLYNPEQFGVAQTALPAGVSLLIGASDGCLANLGAGAIGAGITTLTIGTSGAIRRTVNKPLRDPDGRLFCYYLTEQWDARHGRNLPYYVVGGPTNNGGNVLEWLSEQLSPGQSPVDVLAEAATAPPTADGLLFLPYLQGERAPLWNAHARGAYLNVDWRHGRAHFLRAALEGVLFNLMLIDRRLANLCGPTRVIHANGGFAQSDFWVQLLADISGVPVRLNASNESGAIGAMLLTESAHDAKKSLDELAAQVPMGPTFEPDPATHRLYQAHFNRFGEAVARLAL
jgi:gluconokinase